jgi:protein-tyrosine phosphatase
VKDKIKVLFVCMGNICRSPTAHGVFRQLVEENGLSQRIEIDSAGTEAYHIGNPPDGRAQKTALSRGFDLSDLRARQVNGNDYDYYDYVIAMDDDNMHNLKAKAPGGQDMLYMFLQFAPERTETEVPDPYYDGSFDYVFDLVAAASQGLLADIQQRYLG